MKANRSLRADNMIADRKSGMEIKAIAQKYKVTTSRVSQVTAAAWRELVAASAGVAVNNSTGKAGKDMPDRIFDKVGGFDKDTHEIRNGLSITCASCGKVQKVFSSKGGGMNHTHAAQKFRELGWAVGGSSKADKCPACLGKLASHKPQEEPTKEVIKAFAELPKIIKDNAPAPSPSPPASMSRSDKRIIFAKLNDVYRDEKTGYQPGWSDAKVATDLGVPVEWVKEIRDEDFGPAVDGKSVLAEIRGRMAEVTAKFSALDNLLDTFDGRATAIEDDIKGIKKLVEELAKAFQ